MEGTDQSLIVRSSKLELIGLVNKAQEVKRREKEDEAVLIVVVTEIS